MRGWVSRRLRVAGADALVPGNADTREASPLEGPRIGEKHDDALVGALGSESRG